MSIRATLVSLFLGAVLSSQVTRNEDVPLKNWPAPLYWQPTDTEGVGLGMKPEIQGSSPRAATASAPLVFVATTPCRVVDTRASQSFPSPFGPPSLTPGPARSFPIQSSTLCTIPSAAQAYSFNVTVVPPGALGFLTVWPTGVTQPNAVTLDDLLGTIVNNAAIVPAGTPNGSVSVVVNGNTDLVIDINGYYVPPYTTVNTASGLNALASNTTGTDDTATGSSALFSNTTGSYNTATGVFALGANTTGQYNTASGFYTLLRNTTGSANTATGDYALSSNTTGGSNTATGYLALDSNTTGSYNVASGTSALLNNTTGSNNTAIGGYGTLYNNTIGNNNTASGNYALYSNTSGTANTASGYFALYGNTTGVDNTASGSGALQNNTLGVRNTATGTRALNGNGDGTDNTAGGFNALYANTTGTANTASGSGALQNSTGSGNTATGYNALNSNTTGSYNIAVGFSAGNGIVSSNNIDIGNVGTASDFGVIRIGSGGNQSSFFAAGIRSVTTGVGDTVPVLIDSNGQLGTMNSSRRFKEDIRDMTDASSGLLRLRPVTYRYQKSYADGSNPLDYGLIAEEVAEVYPDLVVKGSDGQVETVQYHKLTPMLLNEFQKLQAQFAALQKEHVALQKALDTLIAGPGQNQ